MNLCLNMIVKDESARILRCLASLEPYIDAYVICDTGSTDGTPDMIRKALNVPGEVISLPFTNFGETRNAALEAARASGFDFDHILLADADMELMAGGDFRPLVNGNAAYRILQRDGNLAYWNTRVIRRDAKAIYRGVTHEYLEVDGGEPLQLPESAVWFRDHADGANRPGKFERDIALLKADTIEHPDNARSWFYLGQSYRDAGRLTEAAETYAKRAAMGGWAEEAWRAKLEESRLLDAMGDTGFAGAALEAYAMRPSRAEPLYDLSRHYRLANQPQLAAMFATLGLSIPYPKDDILFVEPDVYAHGLREEFSISAFYNTNMKDAGRTICDGLALDRNVSRETSDLARKNLWFYAQLLADLAPSFTSQPIGWSPPEGWRAMNPSVARVGEKLKCIVRTVNYRISPEGQYLMPEGETAIRTRNWLATLDVDLKVNHAVEIRLPANWPEPAYDQVIGFEDMRLFSRYSGPWFSATVRELRTDGVCQQVIGRLDESGQVVDWAPISDGARHEKNWAPVTGNLDWFLYASEPTRVQDSQGRIVYESMPSVAADAFRGGSQLIHFDGGWLGIIHEVPYFHCYAHRLIWLDSEFRLKATSPQFRFLGSEGIEFCAGLAKLDTERLVISFGVGDREAWLGTVDDNDVRALLRPVEALPPSKAPPQRDAASFLLTALPWAKARTNRALLQTSEVDEAVRLMSIHGLTPHPDRPKNWDTVIGLAYALETTTPDAAILDAGAALDSAFLPALARFGYPNLLGVNLLFGCPLSRDGVRYERGDITRLSLPDESQDFIFCQSVIEHDVDAKRFFAEMARVLKPKGRLFVSTDYWPDPIAQAWNPIFDGAGIGDLLAEAELVGLYPISPVLADTAERVVTHGPASYAFLNLLFRKTS